jgi:hypothetical protein
MLTSGFTAGTQLPRRNAKYCSCIIIVESTGMPPAMSIAVKSTTDRTMLNKANNGNNALKDVKKCE